MYVRSVVIGSKHHHMQASAPVSERKKTKEKQERIVANTQSGSRDERYSIRTEEDFNFIQQALDLSQFLLIPIPLGYECAYGFKCPNNKMIGRWEVVGCHQRRVMMSIHFASMGRHLK
jgi:hypothetical protein